MTEALRVLHFSALIIIALVTAPAYEINFKHFKIFISGLYENFDLQQFPATEFRPCVCNIYVTYLRHTRV